LTLQGTIESYALLEEARRREEELRIKEKSPTKEGEKERVGREVSRER